MNVGDWYSDDSVVDFGTVLLQLVFCEVSPVSADATNLSAVVLLVLTTFPALQTVAY